MRIQGGAVLIRKQDGETQVLIITNRTGKWGFPKGGVKENRKRKGVAKEVREEAGYTCKVLDKLAVFEYKKDGEQQIVHMFAAEPTGKVRWEESYKRMRQWVSISEAERLLPKRYRTTFRALYKYLGGHMGKFKSTAVNIGSVEFNPEGSSHYRVDDGVGANTRNREFSDVVKHLEEMPLLKELEKFQAVEIKVDGVQVLVRSEDLYIRIIISRANPHAKMLVVSYSYEGVSHTERIGLTKVNALLNRVVNKYLAHQVGTEGFSLKVH